MKTHEKHMREPLLRVAKREAMPIWKSLLIRVLAIVAALGLCSLLSMLLINANPLEFIKTMFQGNFGTWEKISDRRIWKLVKDSAVLLCISLAVTPAFRMKFWNIGAEGQTLVGALASVAMVIYLGGKVPEPVLWVLMLLAGVVAGAIWGALPAIFKAKWKTNETLFTLMMNYVATGLVAYFLVVWTPNNSSSLGELEHGWLPQIKLQFLGTSGQSYLLLILIVLVITVLSYIYLYHTKQGYEISVVGESENTARYIGINVGKVVIRTMIVSGALCGLAGFLIVGALDHSVTTTTVGGLGFTAIMVSWLAKFNPLVMIGSALFVTFLDQGAEQISSTFKVSDAFPAMVVGIILFFIIGCEFFIGYKLKFRTISKKGGEA